MIIKKNSMFYYRILFFIFAILIIGSVLFLKPEVGIADQGDFNRIMSISGLSLLDSDANNPNFIRFYNYIVTDYKISDINNIFDIIFGSSLGYLIVAITYACKALQATVFKTQYLAMFYSIIYILVFSIILKSLNIKNPIKFLIISLLILFIFFDGNYLIWFNSLYGEPMMVLTLLLFIASVLNYIYYKYVLKHNKKIMLKIIYILAAAFLFLGSKLQVITSLPLIIIFIIKIIFDNKEILSRKKLIILQVLLCILIIYPIGISTNSGSLCKDTLYNSVFYGILNGSDTPEEDLIALGLNTDMAVDAGKHAYLNSNEYIKYDPSTDTTYQEFYSKISNKKLFIFYLTHPIRLINGMYYTAGKAFYTGSELGKCYRSYSETPITEFHRFTGWSYFKENVLPKNLFFIISVYLIVFIFSFCNYIKNRFNGEIKNRILLLWTIMVIGAIQFPMPFVGNGQADTSKQLFLFNFIFDGLLVLILSHLLFIIVSLFKHK